MSVFIKQLLRNNSKSPFSWVWIWQLDHIKCFENKLPEWRRIRFHIKKLQFLRNGIDWGLQTPVHGFHGVIYNDFEKQCVVNWMFKPWIYFWRLVLRFTQIDSQWCLNKRCSIGFCVWWKKSGTNRSIKVASK